MFKPQPGVLSRSASWKWLLRLILGVAILTIFVRWQGKGVQIALAGTSWLALATAVALYLASQLLSACKWKVLLSTALQAHKETENSQIPDTIPGDLNDVKVLESMAASKVLPASPVPIPTPTLRDCYRLYLIGMFCNLWLPTAIGGDAVRAALAGKRWGSLSLAASSILVERLTGLFALLAIGAVGWLFWWLPTMRIAPSGLNGPLLRLAFSALLASGVLGLLLWALRRCAFHFEKRSASKFVVKWAQIHRALDLFASADLRPALIKALALSLVFQSTQIGLNLFLARAVGLNLPSGVFLWLIPCLGIASMLPLGIGGLGVREGAALTLLQSALLPEAAPAAATILAWSLLWQATLWLSGLPGAIAYLAQKEERAP